MLLTLTEDSTSPTFGAFSLVGSFRQADALVFSSEVQCDNPSPTHPPHTQPAQGSHKLDNTPLHGLTICQPCRYEPSRFRGSQPHAEADAASLPFAFYPVLVFFFLAWCPMSGEPFGMQDVRHILCVLSRWKPCSRPNHQSELQLYHRLRLWRGDHRGHTWSHFVLNFFSCSLSAASMRSNCLSI